MKRLMAGLILLAGWLCAQPLVFFQQPVGAQVYEYHSGMPGGTYLGVSLEEVDATRARDLKLKETYGVEITRIEEGSPAEKAGLKPNDVVLEYNGQRIEGMEQLGRLVRETPAGREVKLLVSRAGMTQTIAATVAARKAKAPGWNAGQEIHVPTIHIPDIPGVFTTMRSPMLGVEAESLGSQLASYFGVKEGVLVRSVVSDTAAERAGIRAGDVITKVDGATVTNPNEVSSAIRTASSKKAFVVDLVRDHKDVSVSVSIDDGH